MAAIKIPFKALHKLTKMKKSVSPFFFLLLLILIFSFPSPSSQQQQNLTSFSSSNSPWHPTQNKLLFSGNSTFAAGFRPLPNSQNRLFTFSIWYNLPNPSVIWSANLDNSPLILSAAAALSISAAGNLSLTNSSLSTANLLPGRTTGNSNSSLLLNENGNLVYGNSIWESFDFPTDTFLPGQNINGTQLLSKNSKFRFSNSSSLIFVPDNENYYSTPSAFLQLNSDGSVSQSSKTSIISADFSPTELRRRRLTLDDDGVLRIYSYDLSSGDWVPVWQSIQEVCQVHGICGANAICMPSSTNSSSTCVCPPGFRKSSADQTACDRKIPLSNSTKFIRLDYVNFTGGSDQTDLKVANFSTCQSNCLKDPNCLGFMFKFDGQGFCVLQLEKMLYGYWSPGTERAMFLRLDSSEKETNRPKFTGLTSLLETTCPVRISLPPPPEESNTTTRNIAIICTLFTAELISGILFFWAFLKKYIKYRDMARTFGLELLPAGGPKRFTYAELKAATDDFSYANAIGKGGFGDVYKGELPDKRIVAVKCLKHVTGGDNDFWAEVTIIARMHHLNLVRLWGFCAEKGQRILVYEFVPNGSLDRYLFQSGQVATLDSEMEMSQLAIDGRKPMLDWGIRYRIALGVARAIAYLHEECLEWVLHCDIKPENILLGDDFCPKISDFGLAKLRKKEDMVSMSRIRGTRGYMAPEWVKSDQITSKADVYSFGMVLLELVTGSRNFETRGSLVESEDWYFPKWAFDKVFKEMKVEDILDRKIKHCYDNRMHFEMVDRMVKTAMWCLQDTPDSRPSMGKVAKMLEGTIEITEPKQPTIFFLGDE